MRLVIAAALTLALPTGLFAAGEESSSPSKPKCENGQVYDKKTKTCVDANNHRLDTDSRYQTVRSLAYDGQYENAQIVLATMPQNDDRTLTYLGFTNRKMGNRDAAMDFYGRALAVNPGNILARSYMGQGFVDDGDITAAFAQLRAIRDHGGSGSWAEASLRTAISSGRTYNY
ncbi:hypothetical protein C1J03_15230 [Sulfitobacter sp. SK012]|uniref:tetratricopeptide repeat protein n=1 Tax=Sulfitobacter sp. SK012 TaxID=1389005 RepID=UPI000E0B1B8D|nr:hypothetical protein [Sulfitobacter sp. SK012]AXI47243.1 hypothetical protein C1J03_15230 [Sulfitobacter sp. SK012]